MYNIVCDQNNQPFCLDLPRVFYSYSGDDILTKKTKESILKLTLLVSCAKYLHKINKIDSNLNISLRLSFY